MKNSPSIWVGSQSPAVQVAAAVIQREDGSFLLAQRPAGKVYAGYWEFPGGKVEPGEAPGEALARELHEELGIVVERSYPWISRHFAYEHATVDLHFFRVLSFRGSLQGRENQQFAWQRLERIDVGPILPANGPILSALRLPGIYAITDASARGVDRALHDLDCALAQGLRLIQVREPAFDAAQLAVFAGKVIARSHAAGAKVLVNADPRLAEACGADGIHLKAAQLRNLTERPPFALVGGSCHDAGELERAQRLGLDLVVLGPVAPTPSHPDAQPLGWARFSELLRGYPIPVYALGGMRAPDLERSWSTGAHGIAMQRGVWGIESADASR
jgi:8-oxo-dGTP diphosphatase